MKRLTDGLVAVVIVALLFVLGIFIHEAGHSAASLAFGGRLTGLNILGLDFLPALGWNPQPGYYGSMNYEGTLSPAEDQVTSLSGSLATFLAAVAAQAGLWAGKPRRGPVRLAVVTVCCFWLDVLIHTLPTLGVPAYLFFGTRTVTSAAEAYLASVALGMPGGVFQALALGLSTGLGTLTVVRWIMLTRADRLDYVIQTREGTSV